MITLEGAFPYRYSGEEKKLVIDIKPDEAIETEEPFSTPSLYGKMYFDLDGDLIKIVIHSET